MPSTPAAPQPTTTKTEARPAHPVTRKLEKLGTIRCLTTIHDGDGQRLIEVTLPWQAVARFITRCDEPDISAVNQAKMLDWHHKRTESGEG